MRKILEVEIWKRIVIDGEEIDYMISTSGRVYSIKREMIMKPQHTTEGYLFVHFPYSKKESKRIYCRVNRLVAMHFIPNPYNKPEVNHIDGNKENNNVNNLEWATRSENMKHCFDTGLHPSTRGSNNHVSTHTEEDIIKIAEMLCNPNLSLDDISAITGNSKKFIAGIRNRTTWGWLTKDFNFVYRGKKPFIEFHATIDKMLIDGYTIDEICEAIPKIQITKKQLRKLVLRRRKKLKQKNQI